jgi:hypothetical protein
MPCATTNERSRQVSEDSCYGPFCQTPSVAVTQTAGGFTTGVAAADETFPKMFRYNAQPTAVTVAVSQSLETLVLGRRQGSLSICILLCTVQTTCPSLSTFLVPDYRRFGAKCYHHPQSRTVILVSVDLIFCPEDGASTSYRNVGELLPDCTASNPRIYHSWIVMSEDILLAY